LSISILKMVYHSLFHSIMSYGIMFWGNSPHSPVIFKIQKRVLRILMGIGYRDSCRELFKELKNLTLSSQYILSLLLFVIRNGVTLPQIVYIMTLTPDRKTICTCHMYPWLCIRKESCILVSKFLMPSPQQLKTFLATPKNLKLL
jgi:hypothetical protein